LGPAVELGEGNRVRFKQGYLGRAGRSAKHIDNNSKSYVACVDFIATPGSVAKPTSSSLLTLFALRLNETQATLRSSHWMIIIQILAVYRPSTGCLLPELRYWVQTEYQDFDNFFATRRAPIPAKPVSMKRSVVGSGTTVVPELMRTLSSRAPTFPGVLLSNSRNA
jgi:hypothetical protein